MADNIFKTFFRINNAWHYMWIVCLGRQFTRNVKYYFLWKIKNQKLIVVCYRIFLGALRVKVNRLVDFFTLTKILNFVISCLPFKEPFDKLLFWRRVWGEWWELGAKNSADPHWLLRQKHFSLLPLFQEYLFSSRQLHHI